MRGSFQSTPIAIAARCAILVSLTDGPGFATNLRRHASFLSRRGLLWLTSHPP
jgi:hypothetical protein